MASPRLAGRYLALLALLLGLIETSLGGSPRVLAQDDEWVLEDESFTDTEHGWSVEWDEDEWEGELVRGDDYRGVGLTLTRNAFSRHTIGVAGQTGHDDLDACLEWQASSSQYELEPAESEDPPATAEEAAGQLYAATDEQEDLDVLVYHECRPLAADNLFLLVSFVIDERAYEDNVGVWEDLLADIQVEGEDESSGDSEGPGLDGNVYTDVDYGWSVEFDEEVFRGGPVEGDDFTGLNLQYNPDTGYAGFNNLLVFDDGITDPEECLETRVDAFSDSGAFEDFEEETGEDPPQTADDVEGQLFSTTLMPEETDIFYYLECRPLQEAALTVQLAVDVESYEDALPAWEDLLASIDTNASTSGEETNGNGDAGLDGNTFADPVIGYTVEFDDDVWEANELEGADGSDREGEPIGVFLRIADDPSFATVTIDGATGYDGMSPAECVEAYIDSLPNVGPYSDIELADDLDAPRSSDDAEGSFYRYTYTFEDG